MRGGDDFGPIRHVADFLGSIDNPKLEKPFDWNLVSRTLRLVAEGAPS